jgi:hypothetical protein
MEARDAADRQRLSEPIRRVGGLRLLPDNFYGVEQSIIVAKGNAGRASVDRFLDEARASGLIAAAIARTGLAGVECRPVARSEVAPIGHSGRAAPAARAGIHTHSGDYGFRARGPIARAPE